MDCLAWAFHRLHTVNNVWWSMESITSIGRKNHTGHLEKYAFDKEMVKDRLKELCDENIDPGSAVN